MTKQVFTEIVNAHGGPEQIISLVFDNDKIENFVNEKRFSMDQVKTYGDVDVIELPKALRHKELGDYSISTTTVHKLECLQCIGFVDDHALRDKVDSSQFVHGGR